MMSAEVDSSGDTFKVLRVQELFDSERVPGFQQNFDVTRDGERFLVNAAPEGSMFTSTPVTLVVNFPTELEDR